jgi:hypothetical protein
VPCVDPSALNRITQEVLSLVPQEMVQRYRVLPVALNGKKLTLAMADPSDFAAIDEIGFVTGLIIVPRVCSELRLSMALERYYGVKRMVRYIPFDGGSRSRFACGSPSDWHGEVEVAAAKPAPARVSLKSLAERLSAAGTEGEVVTALLAYLGGEFDRGAFLSVRRGSVLGVRAVSAGAAVDGFAGFAAAVDDSELLAGVVGERRFYLGELGCDAAEGRLVEAMGATAPCPGLLLPLAVDGLVAALVCAIDQKGRLAGGVFELQKVGAMAELTFEMICTRKRIRNC